MSAIFYMLRKEWKNRFLALFRHPGKLVVYILLVLLLVNSVVSVALTPQADLSGFVDLRILHGIYFGILLLITVPILLSALQKGTTFFGMSDVNLLFVSPISPKKILAYGLMKQMGRTLLMVFFFLFYGAMMAETFGIVWTDTLALVLGAAVTLFSIQVLSLLLYNFTNGSPSRVRSAKVVLYVYIAAIAGIILLEFTEGGSNTEALLAAISSPKLEYFPLLGWIKGACFAFIAGNAAQAGLFSILTVLAIAVCVLAFVRGNVDYYEDVLQSTETAQEQRDALKKAADGGMLTTNNGKKRRYKVRKTGLGHGWGANTFFYKHMCEARRKSRIPFVDSSTVLLVVVNLGMAFFLSHIWDEDGTPMSPGLMMIIGVVFSCYILFFLNATGAWMQELLKPYIYLSPASSFAKLVWSAMSTILKPVIDGVIVFTVLGIYMRANPLTAILCMLVYASMGVLYIAGSILSDRILGTIANKGLIMMLYMVVLLLMVLPGVGISFILLLTMGDFLPAIVIGLPVVIWNLAISTGVFALCRNTLDNVELTNSL